MARGWLGDHLADSDSSELNGSGDVFGVRRQKVLVILAGFAQVA